MNDIIHGIIIIIFGIILATCSSVDVDFAVCSYKKECFYFISRGIFSLYNVFIGMFYRNFKAVVQRYSLIDDIEEKRELI